MRAKIKEYGITKPKEGKEPSVFVTFSYEKDGEILNKNWFGSFQGGAKQYTIKTLENIFDFQGEEFWKIAGGKESCSLNHDKEYDLVFENSEWNGKIVEKIKYVNVFGSKKSSDFLSVEEAKMIFGKGKDDLPF